MGVSGVRVEVRTATLKVREGNEGVTYEQTLAMQDLTHGNISTHIGAEIAMREEVADVPVHVNDALEFDLCLHMVTMSSVSTHPRELI